MKVYFVFACVLVTFANHSWAQRPTKIVFDTDIAGDLDDVLALAMCHALADRAECTIEAVTVSKTHSKNVAMVDAINTFYGRPDIPIGVTKGQYPRDSKYVGLADQKDGDSLRYPGNEKGTQLNLMVASLVDLGIAMCVRVSGGRPIAKQSLHSRTDCLCAHRFGPPGVPPPSAVC